jgi:hypothetical protein
MNNNKDIKFCCYLKLCNSGCLHEDSPYGMDEIIKPQFDQWLVAFKAIFVNEQLKHFFYPVNSDRTIVKLGLHELKKFDFEIFTLFKYFQTFCVNTLNVECYLSNIQILRKHIYKSEGTFNNCLIFTFDLNKPIDQVQLFSSKNKGSNINSNIIKHFDIPVALKERENKTIYWAAFKNILDFFENIYSFRIEEPIFQLPEAGNINTIKVNIIFNHGADFSIFQFAKHFSHIFNNDVKTSLIWDLQNYKAEIAIQKFEIKGRIHENFQIKQSFDYFENKVDEKNLIIIFNPSPSTNNNPKPQQYEQQQNSNLNLNSTVSHSSFITSLSTLASANSANRSSTLKRSNTNDEDIDTESLKKRVRF